MTDKMYKGVSKEGVLQEALSNAVDTAQRESGVADGIVNWKLYAVNGAKGGLHGTMNTITVTITIIP